MEGFHPRFCQILTYNAYDPFNKNIPTHYIRSLPINFLSTLPFFISTVLLKPLRLPSVQNLCTNFTTTKYRDSHYIYLLYLLSYPLYKVPTPKLFISSINFYFNCHFKSFFFAPYSKLYTNFTTTTIKSIDNH